jgi:phosphoribosylaminoimidazolecarboxamide formyltransferase/IMP cyclohydrolase
MVRVRRALISVSDKTGLVELARALTNLGVTLVSTGGSSKLLKENGIPVADVAEVTGFPEMMDGRVKTLHPKIHGGLLALRDNPEHMRQLREQAILPLDMVVVNLYPFAQTIQKSGVTLEHAIENIDIGGPSMIRSAAKNFRSVAVVTRPEDYAVIIKELQTQDGILSAERLAALAVEAFNHTAEYDAVIHRYLQMQLGKPETFPDIIRFTFQRRQALRYGENPHQTAACYAQIGPAPEEFLPAVIQGAQLHGKELSFNNFMDCHAALELIREFSAPAACIIKHTNPCGVAVAGTIEDAYGRALAADPLSAFGGIVGLNRPCTRALAEQLKETFLECIIAPDFDPAALELLQAKKNIRLLKIPKGWEATGEVKCAWPEMDFKRINRGLLLQAPDYGRQAPETWKLVTRQAASAEQLADLAFAWVVAKHVKSNAIVVAKNGKTIGIGPGQTNRVGAAAIALQSAQDQARGAVMGSDAFFPFRDGIDLAARHGIIALVQPGGSVKDEEVIRGADEHGMAMYFTGMRHFKH